MDGFMPWNIQAIPTPQMWVNKGGGVVQGVSDETGIFITDENGNIIQGD